MRIGRRTQRADDPLIELTGIRTVADEMKEPARVEIICQMQKVELLSDDPHHAGQRGPHGIGSWNAPLFVELIGQALAHPMRLALHTGDAMPHREEERPVRQIARQQPEAVVAQIEHDAPLRELRRELDARHDRDRPAVSRLEYGSDRRTQQRLHRAFRHQAVPGSVEDEFIAAAGFFEDWRDAPRGTPRHREIRFAPPAQNAGDGPWPRAPT